MRSCFAIWTFRQPDSPVLPLKLLIGITCLGFLLLVYMLLEPYWIQIKEIPIVSADIPAAFDQTRIVFVSDIHHGPNFPIKRLQRLAQTLNDLHPDLMIFGGDYYQWGKKLVAPCFEELRKVQARFGKFGVIGNHDYFGNDNAILARQGMEHAGITLLENRSEWIVQKGQRIKIGGVGDMNCGTQDILPTIADVREHDFVILVSHNPEYAERLTTHKIDLLLSGHRHGGQINLFGFWAPLISSRYGQKYIQGIVETPFTKVVISNGIGMVGVPLRFCARPDIIVLTLKRE